MRTLPVLVLSLSLTAVPVPFTPYLVRDINPTATPGSSNPSGFVALGDLTLFEVPAYARRELWRSDGTAAGTYRLAERFDGCMAIAGDRCFFTFQTPDLWWHLWITDGSLPGTFPLSGIDSYERPGVPAWIPRQGVLYFPYTSLEHGRELWRSDGTSGGTFEVWDSLSGPTSSDLGSLTSVQGRLFFTANCRLWRSDGTAAGTVHILDLCGVSSLQALGSRLIFLGTDEHHGTELWVSDGTAGGTQILSDLAAGPYSPSFYGFTVVGRRLFFAATTSFARGEELYVTDGTARGTQRLTWFADPDAPIQLLLTALGDRLLFLGSDATHGSELWTSDGTPKGTRMLLDACRGACSFFPQPILQHLGLLFLRGRDEAYGSELWLTDGTAQGTHRVKDLCPGICSYPLWSVGTLGGLAFVATEEGHSTVLWRSDGTEAGTIRLGEISANFAEVQGVAAGGVLVFAGEDEVRGREPWSSDGTIQGTHLLADLADEDIGGSNPRQMMALGGSVLFAASDGLGPALWRSDGSEAGTIVLKRDLRLGNSWSASATRIYFDANERRDLGELWTSDGTAEGTVRLTPDGVWSTGWISAPVIRLGSRVFFSGAEVGYGSEPWITDGTRAGTRRVADLRPGPDHSYPRDFTVFAGRVWFVAALRLWRSDGTAQGTISFGPQLAGIVPQTTSGGRLWFTGRNGLGRTELWATDGTAANTVRIAERQTIASLTLHAGLLWFLGNGSELWSTDGTVAGTRKLDLPSGPIEPRDLLISDGVRLFLSGYRGLWVSDGTLAGTRKISESSVGRSWTVFAGRLYYTSQSGALYASDGTAAGTGAVRSDGEPREARLLRFGGRLVAITTTGELWQLESVAARPQQIGDLSPGDYSTWDVVKAGSRLFFAAWEEETGWELWALRE